MGESTTVPGDKHFFFATDAPRIAGSEIWLAETLPRLVAYGSKITLALPATPTLDPLVSRLGPKVRVLRYENFTELAFEAERADIRLLQAWFPNTYRLLNYWRNPRWVISHDQLLYHYPLGLRTLYQLIFRYTKARAMRKADGVLTCSRWAAEHLEAVYGLKALGVPNGVDLAKFRPPDPKEREHLRRRFGFTRFTWVMPARYSVEKNHVVALLTARKVPEADFIFVGDGALRPAFNRLARLLGARNARFWPFVEDMPELYRAADGLFFPSLAENQSLTTLEAMASGLPVVTSDIPAQRELVENGREGFTLPPRPTLLAEGLARITQDPALADRMGRAARERVAREHDLKHTTRELFRILSMLSAP